VNFAFPIVRRPASVQSPPALQNIVDKPEDALDIVVNKRRMTLHLGLFTIGSGVRTHAAFAPLQPCEKRRDLPFAAARRRVKRRPRGPISVF